MENHFCPPNNVHIVGYPQYDTFFNKPTILFSQKGNWKIEMENLPDNFMQYTVATGLAIRGLIK